MEDPVRRKAIVALVIIVASVIVLLIGVLVFIAWLRPS